MWWGSRQHWGSGNLSRDAAIWMFILSSASSYDKCLYMLRHLMRCRGTTSKAQTPCKSHGPKEMSKVHEASARVVAESGAEVEVQRSLVRATASCTDLIPAPRRRYSLYHVFQDGIQAHNDGLDNHWKSLYIQEATGCIHEQTYELQSQQTGQHGWHAWSELVCPTPTSSHLSWKEALRNTSHTCNWLASNTKLPLPTVYKRAVSTLSSEKTKKKIIKLLVVKLLVWTQTPNSKWNNLF